MTPEEPIRPLDVLAIAAHPDDIEHTCGGTLIRAAESGYRTGALDLTAGDLTIDLTGLALAGDQSLDVHVGADGRVTEVRLKQSSGSTLLDRTAIDTVKKWRFKPATVDGRPVAEWYHDWRWVFRLEG